MTTKKQCPIEAARDLLAIAEDNPDDAWCSWEIVPCLKALLNHIDEQKRLDDLEPVVELLMVAGEREEYKLHIIHNGTIVRQWEGKKLSGRYRREREGEK